jgi:lipopolysaccharide/colanic/teichoic acid biosynthesis glycosyltransferase
MASHRALRVYIALLVAADACLLALAFVGAALLRQGVDVLPVQPQFAPEHYGLVAAAVIPGLLAIFWLRGAYQPRVLLGGPEEYACIAGGCTYGTLLVVGVSYVNGSLPVVSRGWLLCFWLLAIVLVGAGRFLLRRVAYALRRRGLFVRRVLVVGASDQGLAIAQQLHGPWRQGIEVIGLLDDYVGAGTRVAPWSPTGHVHGAAEFVVLGHPSDARWIAAEVGADLLIAIPAALSWESQQTIAQLAERPPRGLEVRLAPTHYDLCAAQLQPAPLGFVPLVQVHPARLVGVDAVLCRCADLVLAALLLGLLAPAVGCAVVRAWLRGARPLLTTERVLGQHGRPVTLWLLDVGVTERLVVRGAPALLAVLRGAVSLAGPRPVPLQDAERLGCWAGVLLSVKPGLTGPWRLVSARLSAEEQLLADVYWVRNWSIWQHLFMVAHSAVSLWNRARGDRVVQRWAPGLHRSTASGASMGAQHDATAMARPGWREA